MLQVRVFWYFLPLTVGMVLLAAYGLERLILRHSIATIVSVGLILTLGTAAFSYATPI